MKRWTLRILLLLFLGAIVNVAVALNCALLFYPTASTQMESEPATSGNQTLWNQHAPADFPTTPDRRGFFNGRTLTIESMELGTFNDLISAARELRDGRESDTNYLYAYVVEVKSGFPARSLVGRTIKGDVPDGKEAFVPVYEQSKTIWLVIDRGRFLPWDAGGLARIPYGPQWPGFAINTLFYAAVLFALFFGFAQTRRIIRLRRGRCPKCAYDLKGAPDAGCPECGWGR